MFPGNSAGLKLAQTSKGLDCTSQLACDTLTMTLSRFYVLSLKPDWHSTSICVHEWPEFFEKLASGGKNSELKADAADIEQRTGRCSEGEKSIA